MSAATVSRECDVGLTKQLFLDDYVIERMDGLKRVLNQPRRYPGNPIIRPEFPWENGAVDSPHVAFDPATKQFHMYYRGFPKDATWSKGPYLCYGRSTDGLHWEKPMLELVEYIDGTKHNNLLIPWVGSPGSSSNAAEVGLDLNPPSPERRFVMLMVGGITAASADGIHWTKVADVGDIRTAYVPGEPNPDARYVYVGQGWGIGELDHRYRGIWRVESDNLVTWRAGNWAIKRAPDDDPNLEFYNMTAKLVAGDRYNGLYLGYITAYHTDPTWHLLSDGVRMEGTLDVYLAVSRDTIHWTRVKPDRPFFPTGGEGAWDSGMIVYWSDVVCGDKLLFYYGGWNKTHASQEGTAAVGMATLRLDGFISVEPEGMEGTLTTRPFRLAGNVLRLNADARHGSILVEVLRPNGRPVAGIVAPPQYDTSLGLPVTCRLASHV